MSTIVKLRELRENTNKYISQIAKGKSFTVVRRSKPVFKVIPVDELGDEGVWKSIVDFTKINKGGVSAERAVKALRNLDG